MYSRYEHRQERISHDYDRIDDSYGATPTAETTYRSAMSPRVTNIRRSRPSGLGSPGVMTRVYQSFQSTGGSSSGFGPGLASLANFSAIPMRGSSGGSTALVGFNLTRQRDKRDLAQLNDKFAQYVEKVRFLEAQNRKLALELEALRNRSGQGPSRIKDMYDIEMSEAHKLIDDTKRDAAAASVKAQQAEQETQRQQERYNKVSSLREVDRKEIDAIQRKLAENQAHIDLFKRRVADLEDEARRHKAHSQRLASDIAHLRNEIQNEMFLKSSCDIEKLALEDDLATLKQKHEADLMDLRSQTVSSDLDPSQFFRNELAQAIREIRGDYETAMDNQRNEVQNRYLLACNELVISQQRPDVSSVYSEQHRRQEERIRSDLLQAQSQNGFLRAKNEEMKNRIDELQRKLQGLREEGGLAQAKMVKEIDEAHRRLDVANRDFEEVSNLKTSLEKEIATYRELLESQSGLRGYVDRIVQNAEQQSYERSSVSSGGGLTGSVSRMFTISPGSSYGGLTGGGGLSSLISQSSRPVHTYQTISSGFSSTIRDSTGNDNLLRRSGEY